MARSAFTKTDAQAPDVYRSSPFEYVVTAEPGHVVVKCSEHISSARVWVKKDAKVQRVPALPVWMQGAEQL
jgi:hypothetical protein